MRYNYSRRLFLIFTMSFVVCSHVFATDSLKTEMVIVPAGEFTMGASLDKDHPSLDELPAHKVYAKSFYIDKYETTNSEYKNFIDTTGHKVPSHWQNATYPKGKDKHPIYNVTWEDAKTYCDWKGKRLPTEAEWEKAARGSDGRIFPWGNQFDPTQANTMEGGDGRSTMPVGSYEAGKSPYGAHDMAGNVWEWTSDYYEPYSDNLKSSNEHYGQKFKVIRGGSGHFNSYAARTTNRNIMFPSYRYFLVGFRCAATSVKE